MSLTMPRLNVVRVIDPRLELNRPKDYVASKGALVNSWQQFPATTINNSSLQISCNPPSRGIAISRLVFKKVKYTITIDGTNAGADPELLSKGFYAPRVFPISSTTSAEQMTINNATITQSPISQYWPALLWYHNREHNRNGQYSLAPSMMDQWQTYAEGTNTNRNPLAGYADSSSGADDPRGAYSGLEVKSNGATQAVLELTCVEPILLSPFVFGDGSNTTSGFCGIQNMSYNATFGDLSRVMSLVKNQGDGDKNITNVSVDVNSASLLFNYLTPDPSEPVPRHIESSYFSIVSYPTRSSTAVPPGQTVSLTMNSVQVSSIPRRMYVFARRDDQDANAFTTDTFLSLPQDANPLTMTWNNNQFFAQSTSQDLYNMSNKNGCIMTYNQFSKHVGSVVCIDFGAGDVGLMPDEAAGSLGNYQMGITCQFKNTNEAGGDTITPTLYCVVVYEGVFNIEDGNCSQYLGPLNRQDVLLSKTSPNVSWKQAQDIYGGSFFSKLWSGVKKVGQYAKDNRLLSRGLQLLPDPRAQIASRVAHRMGYGARSGGARSGGRSGGARKKSKKKRGGCLLEDVNANEIIESLTLESDEYSE